MSFSSELGEKVARERRRIGELFARLGEHVHAPLTSSVDLRDAGFKLVPVDTNVFPGGFNHLCSGDHGLASSTFGEALGRIVGAGPRRIGIVAESHTSNLGYFDNLLALKRLLEEAGHEVRVLSLSPELRRDVTDVAVTGGTLALHRGHRCEGRIVAGDFRPDLLLLNNDLTSGVPAELEGLDQPLLPSPNLGWWRRRKDLHFESYEKLAGEAAESLGIDPWRIVPLQELVRGVDFESGQGLEDLAAAVDRVIGKTAAKYVEYGIVEKPYAVVKSNAGTYGMAVLPVESGRDVLALNRKDRKKMARGKGGAPVHDVLVQEGVPSVEQRDGMTGEPVFYLVQGDVVGGFFRVHGEKGPRDNLNSRGAEFRQLCYHRYRGISGEADAEVRVNPELVEAYALIARLASLAVGGEQALSGS